MKTFLTCLVAGFVLATPIYAEIKTLNVNGIEVEVVRSASGGFFNLVDPDVMNSGEPGLGSRKALSLGQALQNGN